MAEEDQNPTNPVPRQKKNIIGQQEMLSLADLIGAPIHALIDAEAQAAMATRRFIEEVGFSKPQTPGDAGSLNMTRFVRRSRNAQGLEETTEYEIPTLSLLPIPAMQIRDAELNYVVKIVQTESMSSSVNELEHDNLPPTAPSFSPAARLRGTFASDGGRSQRRSMDMLLKMKINIEQSDLPQGLSRLLNIATESINATSKKTEIDSQPRAVITDEHDN